MMCLASWLSQDPTEVIVVVDIDDTECQERLARVDDPRLKTIVFEHRGQAIGARCRHPAAAGEVVVLPTRTRCGRRDCSTAVQMPFVDPRVGAVGTQQNVYQRTTSIWRRIADWMVDLRYYDYVPAMGRKGAVICESRTHRRVPALGHPAGAPEPRARVLPRPAMRRR